MNTTYLNSGNILQPGDFTQFMVEGVNNQPSIHIAKNKEDPEQAHDNVVSKDHVIDNRCIYNDERPPDGKDGHTPDPWF